MKKGFAMLLIVALTLVTSAIHAQQQLNVWIKIPPVISSNGIISGTTNLPEGTILTIGLAGPAYSQFNRDNVGFAAVVAVSHGAFGPVSIVTNGISPPPGHYTALFVMRDPSMQPPNVAAVIGKNGENLSGPLVVGGAYPNVQTEMPVMVQ